MVKIERINVSNETLNVIKEKIERWSRLDVRDHIITILNQSSTEYMSLKEIVRHTRKIHEACSRQRWKELKELMNIIGTGTVVQREVKIVFRSYYLSGFMSSLLTSMKVLHIRLDRVENRTACLISRKEVLRWFCQFGFNHSRGEFGDISDALIDIYRFNYNLYDPEFDSSTFYELTDHYITLIASVDVGRMFANEDKELTPRSRINFRELVNTRTGEYMRQSRSAIEYLDLNESKSKIAERFRKEYTNQYNSIMMLECTSYKRLKWAFK